MPKRRSRNLWRLLWMVATVFVAAAGAEPRYVQTPRTASCEPVEPHQPGQTAGDSTLVHGKRVARTAPALRAVYPAPRRPVPFYPGERVVVALAGRRLGIAVFDGCTLVPEWTGPERVPAPDRITAFEILTAGAAPRSLRDPRGYRVLHITAWKGQRDSPTT